MKMERRKENAGQTRRRLMRTMMYVLGSLLILSGFAMMAYTVYANFYSGQNVMSLHLDVANTAPLAGGRLQHTQRIEQAVEFNVQPDMSPIRLIAEGTLGVTPSVGARPWADMIATVESVLPDGKPGERAITNLRIEKQARTSGTTERQEILDIPQDWQAAEKLRVWIEPQSAEDARYRPAYTITLQQHVLPFHRGLMLWIFAGPLLGFFCLHIGRHYLT